jgi:hypothetical protein
MPTGPKGEIKEKENPITRKAKKSSRKVPKKYSASCLKKENK